MSVQAALLLMLGWTSADAETLLEALAAADAANPALAAERQRQQATGEAVPQAWAEGLPSVSASLDAGSTREEYYGPNSVSSLTPSGYSISASVPLFRGLQTVNGIRAARARVRAGDQRLSATSQRLFADVATAYADVRRDRKIVRLRRENVRFLTSELAATSKRMRAGDTSRTDVAQAEARREEAKAELSEAAADLVESESRYASLVGRIPGKLQPVTLPHDLLPASLDEAIALADTHGP
ncbi:MAG: TolC family protein, partial [Rhizobiales bacterium]|nr:TolC family protein [Hyphomicrobiales bacterium]